MTFWFLRRLQELHQALLGFLESFCFARVGLYPLCCQVLYHHGISTIVPRFTFFTENFVNRCNQVTKMFRSGHDCTSTSSARSPFHFRPQADVTISVRKSCSQSGKSCNRSLCTSSRSSFLFLFSVSLDSCSGSHRSSSLALPLLSGTGFSVYLLTSNTESCNEDDDEVGVGVVKELVDKPGTTNGT